MTLEVPGNAPDARHIYTKMGFKVTGEVDGGYKDPFWGGLTKMEYNFEKVKHMAEADEFLAHYGVPGMKWGKHKASTAVEKAPVVTSADHKAVKELRQKQVSEMSNAELRTLTARLQLEKQYKDLTPTTVGKGKKYVDNFLASTDKANKVIKFVESPAGKLIGKAAAAAAAAAVAGVAGQAAGGAAKTVVKQLAIGR
jgi:hypothetical protein